MYFIFIILNNDLTTKNDLVLYSDNTKDIRFGIDSDGNYGYYKDGADTVTPFKIGSGSSSCGGYTTWSGATTYMKIGNPAFSMSTPVWQDNQSFTLSNCTIGAIYTIIAHRADSYCPTNMTFTGATVIGTPSYSNYLMVKVKATATTITATCNQYSMSQWTFIETEGTSQDNTSITNITLQGVISGATSTGGSSNTFIIFNEDMPDMVMSYRYWQVGDNGYGWLYYVSPSSGTTTKLADHSHTTSKVTKTINLTNIKSGDYIRFESQWGETYFDNLTFELM